MNTRRTIGTRPYTSPSWRLRFLSSFCFAFFTAKSLSFQSLLRSCTGLLPIYLPGKGQADDGKYHGERVLNVNRHRKKRTSPFLDRTHVIVRVHKAEEPKSFRLTVL
jgi:hypothetical protein